MGELVIARKCHLQCNTKGLDSHDGDRPGGGANGKIYEGVDAAVLWGNLVDHED